MTPRDAKNLRQIITGDPRIWMALPEMTQANLERPTVGLLRLPPPRLALVQCAEISQDGGRVGRPFRGCERRPIELLGLFESGLTMAFGGQAIEHRGGGREKSD